MTGQDLYQLYSDANAEDSCMVPAWDEIEDEERNIWDRTAVLVSNAFKPSTEQS